MRSIQEINEKIKKKEAVVITKEELLALAEEKSSRQLFKEIDVVTTATFGPMCSSGIYFNIGHTSPKIKLGGGKVTLNNVPAYAAFAAADLFLGASALPEDGPRNSVYPGKFSYGGGHIIEDLVAGKDIVLEAFTYGTDCYPRRSLQSYVNIKDLNEANLFNIRNAYQNYNVAVNSSSRIIYTYMGMLRPEFGNATFSSAGCLSPLLCDPYFRHIGIGTRLFLGGGVGYVVWWGTQFNASPPRSDKGVPQEAGGSLAVIGDLKQMSKEFIRGASIQGYGVSLAVGIGVALPLTDEETLKYLLVKDEDIYAPVVDYAYDYPNRRGKVLAKVSYRDLKSGRIILKGKEIPASSFSSLRKARQIMKELKGWMKEGRFLLTEKVGDFPRTGYAPRPFKERPL